MEEVFLYSTGNYLRKNNIFEQNIKIAEVYIKRKDLKLYELSDLRKDLINFNLFLLYNVREQNLKVFSRFFKENRKMRTQITKLINNKIKTITNAKKELKKESRN